MNRLFKITIINWDDHNKGHKKSFKKTQISNNFCTDAKLNTLPLCCRWLFLGLLLTCGDHNNGTITMTERQVNDLLTTRLGALNALNSLKSLQTLTFEIVEQTLFKGDEKGMRKKGMRNETKGAKKKIGDQNSENAAQPQNAAPVENTGPVIAAYCESWKARYKSEKSPSILPRHAKDLKGFVQSSGQARATEMIKSYFDMPDHWFVTKRHDIPTFLSNLNAVTQFMETGRMITRKDIQNLEKSVNTQNLLDMVDKGEI